MNFRSCSGEMNRLERSYHSGETGDLAYVVSVLGLREPSAPIAVVGFSLGGNVLLKWLGESAAGAPIHCGVAVSVPYELGECADRLGRGVSKTYGSYLLYGLKRKAIAKATLIPNDMFDLRAVRAASTLRQFDDCVTAPVHGFSGADDYYGRCSSKQYLRAIARPTLLIHAKDDPFMTADVLPRTADLSSETQLELSNTGGHVGFVCGTRPTRPLWWLEYRIPRFLCDQLDFNHGADERSACRVSFP